MKPDVFEGKESGEIRDGLGRMPRVVPDQREKFENDELFRRLSRESEIRYTSYRELSVEERQSRLQAECREGHADVVFVSLGINLQLFFESNSWSDRAEDRVVSTEFVDFNREQGKVHLKSQFIMNGVCVIWKGWLDLHRLDGTAHLEFDQDRAFVEDCLLREQIEQYNQQVREYHRQVQTDQGTDTEREVVQALLHIATPCTTRDT